MVLAGLDRADGQHVGGADQGPTPLGIADRPGLQPVGHHVDPLGAYPQLGLQLSADVLGDGVDVGPVGHRPGQVARVVTAVVVDQLRIATFSRLDDGLALAANELRLKYKQVDKNGRVRLGAESFFFQEGQAEFSIAK